MVEPISVIVPTYKRTANIIKTMQDIGRLKDDGIIKVFFVCHETDKESQVTANAFGVNVIIDTQPPSGVNATNAGYWGSDGEWFVIAQDDFKWHDGWLENSIKYCDDYKVIGYNDGSNSGRHEYSVGWLIHRPYVEEHSLSIGVPNVIFNPNYKKNFSDTELNDIAKYRGVWKYAKDAVLEHLHPTFNKSSVDSTYSDLEKHLVKDMDLYNSRKHLWGM